MAQVRYHPHNMGLVTEPDADSFTAYGLQAPTSLEMPHIQERGSLERADVSPEKLRLKEVVEAAIQTAAPTYQVIDWLQEDTFEADPDFNPLKREEMQFVDPQWISMLGQATSDEDFNQRMEKINQQQNARNVLAESGFTGTAISLVAGIVDPISLLTIGGELKAFSRLAQAGKTNRTLGAGLGAAGGAVYETPFLMNETTSAEDALLSVGMGAAAGTLFSSMPADVRSLTRDAVEEIGSTPPPRDMGSAVGAAQTRASEPTNFNLRRDADGDLIETDAQMYKDEVSRWDNSKVKQVMDSKLLRTLSRTPIASDALRMLGSKSKGLQKFAWDHLENASAGVVNNRSTAAVKSLHRDRWMSDGMGGYYDGLDRYMSSVESNPVRREKMRLSGEDRQLFNRELREELEARRVADENGTEHIPSSNQAVSDAADAWQKTMDDVLETLQARGLMPNVSRKAGYVPLIWDGKKLLGKSKAQREQYRDMLADSYRSMDIDDETAQRVADAAMQRALKQGVGIDVNPQMMFGDNLDELRRMLSEDGMSQGNIDDLVSRITRSREGEAAGARGRRRTTVDLNFTNDEGMSLLDVVDNDMGSIMTRYSEEMSGSAALAEKGILTDADWQNYTQAVKDDMLDAGYTPDEIRNWGTTMDGLNDAIMGRPRGSGVDTNASRLMEFARLSMMGRMGFSQAAEYGQLMGRHGVGAFMKHSSGLRDAIKAARAGEDSTVLTEIAALGGRMWDEHLIFRPDQRLERADAGMRNSTVDKLLARGNHLLNYGSGFNAVHQQQKAVGTILEANKLASMLRDTGKLTDTDLRRLDSIGITSDIRDAIAEQIGRYAEFNGNTLDRLNLDQWRPDLAEDLTLALNRSVGQQVQRAAIGETSSLLHSTTGALMTQFLQFPIVALEKQLARGIQLKDAQAAYTAITSFATAAMATAARHTLYGEWDTVDSEAQFAMQASRYWAQASILPDMWDTAAAIGIIPGEYGTRNIGRTGSVTDPTLMSIFSPAIGGYASGVSSSVNAAGQFLNPAIDREITDSDRRAFRMMTPFGNTLPMAHLLADGE